ncbi:MAG: helix-turn-helix domain-containing protein [Eubacteriales bacterium]
MLLYSSMPLKTIALYLAFYDVNHFTKSFKKFYAITPREYRKNALH